MIKSLHVFFKKSQGAVQCVCVAQGVDWRNVLRVSGLSLLYVGGRTSRDFSRGRASDWLWPSCTWCRVAQCFPVDRQRWNLFGLPGRGNVVSDPFPPTCPNLLAILIRRTEVAYREYSASINTRFALAIDSSSNHQSNTFVRNIPV